MKMEQLDQVHNLKQQIQTPTKFNLIQPSIIQTHPSFNSYLQTNHSNDRTHQNSTNDSDQINIFDAAKYFSDLNGNANVSPMQNGSSKVIDLTSMSRLSSVSSSIDTISNSQVRSFHATPTASSEASWNSKTCLLTNPPGSRGVNVNCFSTNSTPNGYNSKKWGKILNPKWLIPPRRCPCSGKKSVQVDERVVEVKTPRMVDLRRSSSSNGSLSNASSFYSTRQNSPCNKNMNGGKIAMNDHNKVIDSVKLVVDNGSDVRVTSGITSHGFTFPILEDQPVAVKKMFNVILSDQQQFESLRDSLEVFQPKSDMSYEDENVSDGSSDLFEIESFSTKYQRRDSIDDNENDGVHNRKKLGLNGEPMMDVVASNECYAPSEVSADHWGIASAEGFDRASLTNFSASKSEIGSAAMRKGAEKSGCGGVGKDEGTNGGGLLMSCRCEKAVSVGPGPVKCPADGPTVKVARHVGGREEARQEGKLGMVAQVGSNGNGKVGLIVGRQRSSLVPIPLST